MPTVATESPTEPQSRTPQPVDGRGALFAGGLAAILASTCCLATFDDAKTSVAALTKATTDAGYPSTVKGK